MDQLKKLRRRVTLGIRSYKVGHYNKAMFSPMYGIQLKKVKGKQLRYLIEPYVAVD